MRWSGNGESAGFRGQYVPAATLGSRGPGKCHASTAKKIWSYSENDIFELEGTELVAATEFPSPDAAHNRQGGGQDADAKWQQANKASSACIPQITFKIAASVVAAPCGSLHQFEEQG